MSVMCLGNVITRPSQLDYSECRVRPGTQFTGGIWAPTIRHHDGVFYVITTYVQTHKDWDDYSRWHNVCEISQLECGPVLNPW
jgi:beta-xylosidase